MLKSSDPEIQCVFDFTLSLAAAIKNYTLYPQHHAIAKKHLGNISRQLRSYFSFHNCLRLDVDKLTLAYDGDVVYRGLAKESDIAYLLSRDGVQYLEFLKAIELWELQSLLKLINRNRKLDEENDGDIVTDLWEKDYPHIRYKAIDILSLDAPPINFSSFKVTPDFTSTQKMALSGSVPGEDVLHDAWDEGDFTSDIDEVDELSTVDAPPVSIAITAKGNNLWSLSSLEEYELEKMVAVEAERDDTDDIIDILLIMLVLQNNEDDFGEGLDFLLDRYIRSLKVHRFDAALKVLENLKNIRRSFVGKKDWSLPKLDDFFTTVSQPESLRDVERLLLDLSEIPDSGQIKCLWSILHRLEPEILCTIAPLTGKVQAADIRQTLADIILHHAQRDPQALAKTVHLLDAELCEKLMEVAEQMKTSDGNKILAKMSLHPLAQVRRPAFEILVYRDMIDPLDVFLLLNDSDEGVREKIFSLLQKKRDKQIETRLLTYLKEGECSINTKEHLLACYNALGHCGSVASVPLLQEVLMGGGWGSLVDRSSKIHKQGAAYALGLLGIDEANRVLQEGAGSMIPDIRRACRKVIGK